MVHIPTHAPATGLIGSEQALGAGFDISRADITGASQRAIDLLGAGFGSQIGASEASLQAGRTGLIGETGAGIEALQRAGIDANALLNQGVDILGIANQLGQGFIGQNIGQGVQGLQGFAQPGGQATDLLAAFSGASGVPAQQQAFATAQANPFQQFLREQGREELLRTAAARGGLGGGNLEKDLLQFGQGNALQGLQSQFGLLGQLGQQGLTAAGQQAGLRGQQAGLSSGLVGQLGIAGAQNFAQQGQNVLGVGRDILGARTQLGGQLGQLGATEASQRLGFAAAPLNLGASILQREGQDLSNIAFGSGQLASAGRTRAGEQIAGAIGGTSSQLAGLLQQQGAGLADILGAGGGNLAQILQNAGITDAQTQQQLATLLANISTGQGSTLAGLPGIPGTQQTQGILGGLGSLAGGIGGLLEFL